MSAGNQPLEKREYERVRREERTDTIRIVEYSRFPRNTPRPRQQVGFTRDISRSGMCLGVDEVEEVGALLRVCTRDVQGRPGEARVGRVVWTSATRDGRHWLGIEMLTPATEPGVIRLHRVRRRSEAEPTSF